jgi:ferredoxin
MMVVNTTDELRQMGLTWVPGVASCSHPSTSNRGTDGKALVRCDGGALGPEGTLTGLTQAQADQVREAAMSCPPEAITVRDADTGEQYYP